MTTLKIILIALIIAISGWGCSASQIPEGLQIRVERVVSGQTIEYLDPTTPTPTMQQVRLIGIASPDLNQHPWGRAAQNRLTQLVQGREVILELGAESRDRFDRVLAYVWLDDILLNKQLVEEGYVLAEEYLPNTKYSQTLEHAQLEARTLKRGIWNPQQPLRLTPREFRRQR
ncbi:MAG: thermonuclease family protein [Microcoleaceae cyanobacterium]